MQQLPIPVPQNYGQTDGASLGLTTCKLLYLQMLTLAITSLSCYLISHLKYLPLQRTIRICSAAVTVENLERLMSKSVLNYRAQAPAQIDQFSSTLI